MQTLTAICVNSTNERGQQSNRLRLQLERPASLCEPQLFVVAQFLQVLPRLIRLNADKHPNTQAHTINQAASKHSDNE